MTPEDHNKTLGICHIVYGGFYTLIMGAMLVFFLTMFSTIPPDPRGGPPMAFFGFIFGLMFVFYLLFSLPSFIAGYALLKRRDWAKIASIIAAVFESMSFPIGTALCIYSLWFSLGDAGKSLYDRKYQGPMPLRAGEPTGLPAWAADNFRTQSKVEWQPAYRPPIEPPDWRG
jgi:hypothetical protein